MIRHMAMTWLLFASTASAWAAVADWSEEMKGRPSADRWTYAGIDFSSEPGLWVFRPSAYLSSEGILQPLLDQPKHTLDVRFRFPGTAPTPEDSPGFNHPLLFEQESDRCSETAPLADQTPPIRERMWPPLLRIGTFAYSHRLSFLGLSPPCFIDGHFYAEPPPRPHH